ncbi:patatin-like phospholipase family protein [Candidatus Bipolaricaulota bacterium]|nr:patatin-like phospholipase family protein [Candidatus Bipolaricaulota bacterium]
MATLNRKTSKLKIGLALGSGGARGSAHTGVLKVLEAEGIPISVVAGSSIGSLIGAALAVGISTEQVEEEWLATGARRVFRSFLPTFPRAGLSSGNELKKYLAQLLGDTHIEDLDIPYAAVACDIDTGESVVLTEGSLVDAVRASTAIPGIFHPVRLGGRLLVDGGLVEPVPIHVCRELGADFVIAVDITPKPVLTTPKGRNVWNRIGDQLKEGLSQPAWVPSSLTEMLEAAFREKPESERPLPGLYSILNQSIAILLQEVLRQKLILSPPDVLIQPNLSLTMMSYLRAEDGIAEGIRAAEAVLPELRQRLAESSAG